MVLLKPEKEGRLLAALLFSLGILQIAGFWFAGAMVNGDGPLAIPQPDTPLYLQSARRVAEGFPFSFSTGSAVSTGSTTVLHPFFFAIPYLIGFKGDSFIACSFVLNAFFYLVFLFGWGVAIRRWVSDPVARLLAVVLLALFGQTAYAAMALSDIGLWLAVSGLFIAGLASERRWLYGSMLILGPWIRPEGMVLAIAFFLVICALRLFVRDRFRKADGLLAVAGIISMFGVFALNYALTGAAQFSSVALKGHFATRPFFAAVYCSLYDLLRMGVAFLFGAAVDAPRQFYMLPIIGAVAFWTGMISRKWDDWRQYVFPLAVAGGVWTVATSGWQNTNVDRYVAWIMPFVVILSAEGYVAVYKRLSAFRSAALVLILPVLFALGAAVSFWSLFHTAARQSDLVMKFGRELNEVLPPKTTVGLTGYCGLAYPLGDHGLRTLHGIYSPEFEGPYPAYGLEILKNRLSTRFDYWLFAEDDDFAPGFEEGVGEAVIAGPEGINVRKADWTMFDNSAAVPVRLAPNMTLRQRVDVGFPAEERLAGYEAETRYGLAPLQVFQHVDDLDGRKAYESGRVIWGMDSMFVALEPGKDVVVVLRTLRKKDAGVVNSLGSVKNRHFDFGPKPSLNVSVDGKIATTVTFEVPEKGFADVTIRIPGSAIVNPVSRIAFMGDHIACCYWFFQ